jgi:hypothetical protein
MGGGMGGNIGAVAVPADPAAPAAPAAPPLPLPSSEPPHAMALKMSPPTTTRALVRLSGALLGAGVSARPSGWLREDTS